jgi:hypothetical protein
MTNATFAAFQVITGAGAVLGCTTQTAAVARGDTVLHDQHERIA